MRNSSSRVSRLLPPLREDARSVARFPALNARYPLTPLLRFTSRAMVLGARARRRAIAESVSLCARLRLTSSRSADVSRRYCFIVCIRIYCTHIRCVKCLTPSSKKHLKSYAKLFSAFMPRLWVMICPKGAFELMADQKSRPELQGEARFLAERPIAEWKPEVME